jgi:phospholipase/carboxylesterase
MSGRHSPATVSRRQFLATASGTAISVIAGGGCLVSTQSASGDARLTARPRANVRTSLVSGPLGLGGERDGVVQMPSAAPTDPVPVLIFLHGATQRGASLLPRVAEAADRHGVAVVLPDSRDTTWDAIRDTFGDDVRFLNRVLDHVFSRVNVDPARLTIGGFSDGASYALSLGLANGDLFPRVVACSPGFVMPAPVTGRPRFFVSHGTTDQVLPIDQCSRVIVPRLRAMGYDVSYREFDGRHQVPPEIASEALAWMSASPPR